MEFRAQCEWFGKARSALLLPTDDHEAIASAFTNCNIGLPGLDRSLLDESASHHLRTLEQLMTVDGLEDPKGEGAFLVRARLLTANERAKLVRAIDELADWFTSHEQ